MQTRIRWPQGRHPTAFINKVLRLAPIITNGSMLVIDPSSGSHGKTGQSYPGYARFEKGKLIESGIIELSGDNPVHLRLPVLYDKLDAKITERPDILVIEELRGTMTHASLYWAVGATIASIRSKELLEVPVGFWHVMCPKGYKKSDEADAQIMGATVLEIIKEFGGGNAGTRLRRKRLCPV